MKDLNKITSSIKYEDIFEKELSLYKKGDYAGFKADILFKYNGHYFDINDDFNYYKQYNLWLIIDPLNITYNVLKEYNIQFLRYKIIIYGYYKNIIENEILKVLIIN